MTDSGALPPVRPVSAVQQAARADARAQVEDISGPISDVSRTVRVDGVVKTANPDGSVTISTGQGDVTVRMNAPPPVGQSVEIDVPPGHPPRQVTIRAIDAAPQPSPQAPSSSGTAAPAPPGAATGTVTPGTPDVQAAPAQTQRIPPPAQTAALPPQSLAGEAAPAPLPARAPLEQGQAVRLMPLPPGQTVLPGTPAAGPPVAAVPDPAAFAASLPAGAMPPAAEAGTSSLPAPAINSAGITPPPLSGGPEQTITTGRPVVPVVPPQVITQTGTMPPSAEISFFALPPSPEARSVAAAFIRLLPGQQGRIAPGTLLLPSGTGGAVLPAAVEISGDGISGTGAPPGLRPGSIDARVAGVGPIPVRLAPPSPLAGGGFPGQTAGAAHTASFPAGIAMARPAAGPAGAATVQPGLVHTAAQGQSTVSGGHVRLAGTELIALPLVAGENVAEVTGFTPQGLPVLSMRGTPSLPPQYFVLQFPPSNVAAGSHIALAPLPAPEGSALAPYAPLWDHLDDAEWPALANLSSSLAAAGPQAGQALNRLLPSPAAPAQLPPAALLFLAAARSGDIESWLGDKTVDIVRRSGKGDLLARLARDMGAAGRMATETLTQDWKALPLPLYADGEIQKAMLWFRRDNGGGGSGNGKPGGRDMRFLFDLNLNRMGAVQLDGLARGERMDLILRTLRPVGPAMRQTMRQLYLKGLKQAGFSGELSFQDKPDQFVRIDTRPVARAFR